jgi:hypothetical protein
MGGPGKRTRRRTCKHCHSEFLAARKHAQYCSACCRVAESRLRLALRAPPPAAIHVSLSFVQGHRLRDVLTWTYSEATDKVRQDQLGELLVRVEEALYGR